MHALWSQITSRIEDAKAIGVLGSDIDSTIVDINFALKDFRVFSKFKQIENQMENIENLNIKCMNHRICPT